MEFYKRKKDPCESNAWKTAKNIKRSKDVVLMLGLNESIDNLAMAYRVHWYCDVFRRKDGHALRMAIDYEVEGQRKKWRLKTIWEKQFEEESVKVGLRRKDAICRSR